MGCAQQPPGCNAKIPWPTRSRPISCAPSRGAPSSSSSTRVWSTEVCAARLHGPWHPRWRGVCTPPCLKRLLRGRFVAAGVLAGLDGFMNIAMEQTEEYVNGQLKNKYGDCFIRGNNGALPLLRAVSHMPAALTHAFTCSVPLLQSFTSAPMVDVCNIACVCVENELHSLAAALAPMPAPHFVSSSCTNAWSSCHLAGSRGVRVTRLWRGCGGQPPRQAHAWCSRCTRHRCPPSHGQHCQRHQRVPSGTARTRDCVHSRSPLHVPWPTRVTMVPPTTRLPRARVAAVSLPPMPLRSPCPVTVHNPRAVPSLHPRDARSRTLLAQLPFAANRAAQQA